MYFIRVLMLWLCFFMYIVCEGQVFSAKNYPKNYFKWPVGATPGIVANFGELRPNHYHMGLDCRTDKKVNTPIYAAADGYIAKVKIEPYGFGRCIYLNHPNGTTTLYAHLNAFEPALETYVTQQQYNLQQWKVFLDIPAQLFKVKQGDFIAQSGNTGGSQGPHLHFEIRSTLSDKCLNPLMFGLPIPDNVAPEVIRLAVYDRSLSTYDQLPKLYPLKKVNGTYTLLGQSIIAPSANVSFALTMQDKITGSTNPNGVYAAAVIDNDKLISRFELDSISYAETRYFNAHIDYKLKANGGPWLQHLSPLSGYENKIYTTDSNKGIVMLDSVVHTIKIIVADANFNLTNILFTITPPLTKFTNKIFSNTQKMIPNYLNVFESKNVHFYLPENALYDTVNFVFKETQSANYTPIYELHNASIPVQCNFPVSIKASFALADTGKIVMKRYNGSKQDYAKATYNNGWYTASFRAFGSYQLLVDTMPPSITPIGLKNGMNVSKLNRLLFSVRDNTEEIQNFTALLDGKWLRFTNDKGIYFSYTFDDKCEPGAHQLKIIATDQVGNSDEKIYNFIR